MSPATSPDPALPGAWPASPSRPTVDPIHLEHVLEFQQRLVSQMDSNKFETPTSASFTVSASADSAIAPADSLDSELTRVRTDTSASIATSASTTFTSRSSPERLVTAKLPPLTYRTKYSSAVVDSPTRIPRPTNSLKPTRKLLHSRITVTFSTLPEFSSTCSRNITLIITGYSSSVEPTGIAHCFCVTRVVRFSTFPIVTKQCEYDDRHMLLPSPSPSSSPSPISSRANLAVRPSSIVNRTPSIEINAAIPMLTSLSLPASPETSLSLEVDPIVTRSPRLSPIDGDASPWSLSLSPVSPVLWAFSVFPVSLVLPVSIPAPFPALGSISESEDVGNTSAAEYAAAIMSSAWAPDGPSLAPVVPAELLSGQNEAGPALIDLDAENALTLEEEGLLAYSQTARAPPSPQDTKTSGVFGKMKKIGDKFKKLLRGKSKVVCDGAGVNVDVDVRRAASPGNFFLPEALPDVIDIHSHTSAAQVYNNLLPNHGTDDSHLPLPLPPPPGLTVRNSSNYPILSSQTYSHTRMNDNSTRQNTPTIRIRPPSSSSHLATANDDHVVPKSPSPDLTIHSRPKTLAEIKSKRRLSLSMLPNFTRVAPSIPPVNVTNRARARPASALAFYPRPTPLSSPRVDAQTDSNALASQRLEVPRSMSSRLTTAPAISGTVRSEISPASMALARDNRVTADAIKKKNCRFSLSALSNFAGHRDEGSWGRNP
ncbi:Aspartate aminotransferase [Mycena sanguinolenta]|uniref:Aspartate aminotransferase n=1 Tax=Mycena sanguinolenta TaxID=230812 RepID=A0A8H6XF90_9AGAR|nr:Aspartate aminotransferase [Mycena sanguinolenta]